MTSVRRNADAQEAAVLRLECEVAQLREQRRMPRQGEAPLLRQHLEMAELRLLRLNRGRQPLDDPADAPLSELTRELLGRHLPDSVRLGNDALVLVAGEAAVLSSVELVAG